MNKKTQAVLYSSEKQDHCTPKDLFIQLHKEFMFTCDVACSEENSLCQDFITEEENAFKTDWGRVNWCNPPYGRKVGNWIIRATEQHRNYDSTTVMLLPSRTDTKWFHKAMESATEVRFIKGRLKFEGQKAAAPFPSLLLIWSDITYRKKISQRPYSWQKFILGD